MKQPSSYCERKENYTNAVMVAIKLRLFFEKKSKHVQYVGFRSAKFMKLARFKNIFFEAKNGPVMYLANVPLIFLPPKDLTVFIFQLKLKLKKNWGRLVYPR